MNIRTKTTNVVMSPVLEDYVAKSLVKLSKLVSHDPSAVCDVELSRTTNHHQKGDIFRAEIHVVGQGVDAYAASEHEDLNMAITDVKEEILRSIRGRKSKRMSMIRRGGARMKSMMKGIWPFK